MGDGPSSDDGLNFVTSEHTLMTYSHVPPLKSPFSYRLKMCYNTQKISEVPL